MLKVHLHWTKANVKVNVNVNIKWILFDTIWKWWHFRTNLNEHFNFVMICFTVYIKCDILSKVSEPKSSNYIIIKLIRNM